MERTKHGKESALAIGLAKMHVCVFYWDMMKDYVLELMIAICVFRWNLMKDYMLELIIVCEYSTGRL